MPRPSHSWCGTLHIVSYKRNYSTEVRIKWAERERRALELRKQGMTYDKIAQELGFANRSSARDCVQRCLARTVREPADEVRQLECERLDALLQALWPRAMEGNTRSVEVALQVMDRRARLLGLDMPERKVVEVLTADVVDRAIQELEIQLAVEGIDLGDQT